MVSNHRTVTNAVTAPPWPVRVLLLLCILLLISACNGPAEESLVAHWSFDGSTTAAVVDVSGNGNNGELRNGARGPGLVGRALKMDGGDDGIVVVPLSDSLRSTANAITVMGWAYRTADHNVDLIGHGYPALFLGFHGPQFKWQIKTEKGKLVPCYAKKKHRAELNRWFHVAGTWNGYMARLYVDGEQICSNLVPFGGRIAMREVPFSISGYLDEDGGIVDEITGRIDEVRVYSRALGADEIRAIYEAVPIPATEQTAGG